MHKITFNIDWLTFVTDLQGESRLGLPGVLKSLVPTNGRWGYDVAYRDEIQGYTRMISSTRPDMGVCYVFSAQALDELARSGKYQDRLSALKAFGASYGKVTRLDLCLDVHDAGNLAYVVADLADQELINTSARKVTVIRNIPAGTGVTTYLGARSSPSYIRVYDKHSESHGINSVTRFELECKAHVADELGHIILSGNSSATLEDTVLGAFLGVFRGGIATLLMTYLQDVTLWSLQAERIAKRMSKHGW